MIALALQAVAAFNLVCSVHTTVGTMGTGMGLSNRAESDSVVTLRVDLQSRRWCIGDCRETAPLAAVTDTEIWFDRGTGAQSTTRRFVNRESGTYTDSQIIGTTAFLAIGTCEPAPFTGFPGRRF